MSTVVDAQAVSKQFLLRHNASVELKVRFLGLLHRRHRQTVEEFWALRNVSITIEQGEGLALVGRNGSGKSTFLKLIAAIHQPTSGRILVARGARIASMIELGVGFHPELTGRENVFLNTALHGLTVQQTEALYDGIVRYSGLEHFIDVPIKNYSSGMHMRLGFAIAAQLDPDVLLLDEIFAVGDADFQGRCVETLKGFMDAGKTIVFVSHSPIAVRTICRRTCVLDHGQLIFDGEVERGLAFYEQLIAHGTVAPDAPPPAQADLGAPQALEDTGPAAEGWVLQFLRQEGLQPAHRVLLVGPFQSHDVEDVRGFVREGGCARLADAAALLEGPAEEPFDVVLVLSVLSRLTFNDVARCLAGAVRRLERSGRVYATWFESPDAASFEPVVRAGGTTTYADREPYHYPFSLIEVVCAAVGADAHRMDELQPGGESMLVISRRE